MKIMRLTISPKKRPVIIHRPPVVSYSQPLTFIAAATFLIENI